MDEYKKEFVEIALNAQLRYIGETWKKYIVEYPNWREENPLHFKLYLEGNITQALLFL